MDTLRDPPHYLRGLTTTKTPQRLLWLDCATYTTRETGAYVQRFHSAALGTTHWAARTGNRMDTMKVYEDPTTLWHAADSFCTANRRVVLFAHDLATQIRTSQAMVCLPEYGWELQNIVLERTAAWALYRDGKRSLLMCDLRSWAPVDLGLIASDVTHCPMIGWEAEAGPEYKAKIALQRASCVRDAVLQIINWIEGENLGPFRPTGSGQSYSAFRRRFGRERLLVHDDTQRLDAERTAMHTGRCEAWRHGTLTDGPYIEYDMQAAYCRIAAECEVPTIARSPLWNPTPARVKHAMQRHAILAHITVQTDIPVLPTRMGGRTLWPTGEFSTWVWDPELQLAFDYCNKVTIHHAYRYERAPALRDFATFVLDGMGEQTQVYGLVPRRVLKHWSRCLVGRLGLRYRSWQRFAHADEVDLRLVTYIDTDEGMATDLLIAGRDWLMLTDMQESLESLPQIPSWVMSECRRRLWDAMLWARGLLVYVDTDSIIVGQASKRMLDVANGTALSSRRWGVKGEYRRMVIHGPRNYHTESGRHIAGLPLSARQTAPLEFTGQVMRSVKESMRAGQLDCVAEIPRKFVLSAPDLRRRHLPGGATEPYEVKPTTQEDLA